ncbi:hypothetical protein AN1V17_45300 [Vallitalea sediminicola]
MFVQTNWISYMEETSHIMRRSLFAKNVASTFLMSIETGTIHFLDIKIAKWGLSVILEEVVMLLETFMSVKVLRWSLV